MRRGRLVAACLVAVCLVAGTATTSAQELASPEAWKALERGDHARASGLFREALERSPRDASLHFGAGWAAYALGRNDAAIGALKKALELDSRFLQAAVLLGTVAYASSDLDLAIRAMDKAATLAPGDERISRQLDQWRREAALHSGFEQRPGLRFRVLFEGTQQEALGRRVQQVLEASYWQIGQALNSYPGETLTVVLYTNKQFTDVTRAPAWAAGGYDGRIRLAVGGAMRTPAALDRVVRHELVHAMIQHVAPRNVPAWLNEGLASVLEGGDPAWIRQVLSRAREVFTLEDLEHGFGHLDGAEALLAYAESAAAAQILVEKAGPNLGVLLQMVGTGHTVDQALSTVNVRPEAFHAAWRARVGLAGAADQR